MNDEINIFDLDQDGKLNSEEIMILRTRWIHKRRMAWVSLFSIIGFTLLFLFVVTPEKLKILSETITWLYITLTSIVGAFMGFSALAAKPK